MQEQLTLLSGKDKLFTKHRDSTKKKNDSIMQI